MFFEGNEKKLEVIVSPEAACLRENGDEFWSSIVESAGARVLSILRSPCCTAYLLSESSLFVWSDRFTLITCGQTTLVRSVESFFQFCNPSKVRSLIYERKNEYFPQLQKTDFFQDVKDLNLKLDGKALQFGNSDEHHLQLYNYNNDFVPASTDFTLEILMYDLQGVAREVFARQDQSIEQIRTQTRVDKIFEGFEVDDHLFEPFGYSLNALRGEDYYTIHVTPQDVGTYVSFETNVNLRQNIEPTVKQVLEVFNPRRFDIVMFSPVPLDEPVNISGFAVRSQVQTHFKPGYFVSFSHHYLPQAEVTLPFEVLV